jgi:conjugal transfer pilus assembly protein TraD
MDPGGWRISPYWPAAVAWSLAAALTALGTDPGVGGPSPRWPGLQFAIAAGCASFAAARAAQALAARRTARTGWHRAGRPLTHADLSRRAARRPERVLIGVGCRWGPAEALALARLERSLGMDRRASIHWSSPFQVTGRPRPVEVPVGEADGNWLVIGAPGTGKTALFVLLASQAIHRGDVVVVIDPKGSATLRHGLELAAHQAGRAFHPLLPGCARRSVRFDPLASWLRASDIASRITRLVGSSGRPDPFVDFAWMTLTRLADATVYLGERPTLISLRDDVRDAGERLLARCVARAARAVPGTDVSGAGAAQVYRDRIRPVAPVDAIEGLLATVEHDRAHYAKMILSVAPILDTLTAGDLGSLLSPRRDGADDPRPLIDSAVLLRHGGVLYAALESMGDPQVTRAIGGILLADLASAAGARYRSGRGGRRVALFVDEAGEVVNGPFVQLLNKGREAGFASCFAVQTLADLEIAAGSPAAAEMLVGNANGFIVLRTQDVRTQRYAADKLGRLRASRPQLSRSISEPTAASSGEFGRAATRSERDEDVDAMPKELMGRLPDLHAVVSTARGRMFVVRIPTIRNDTCRAQVG